MENRLIEIQDLEVGDEIILSCQSFFKYLKVLATPKLSATKKHWKTQQPLYGNVRCSTRQEEVITYSYTDNQGVIHHRKEKRWIPTPDEHNIKISQDLNGRQIWLVKREEKWNKD